MFQTKFVEKNQSTYFVHSIFFFENRAAYETMRKNIVEQVRPQMIMRRMRVAFWISKATNTHSQYCCSTATMVAWTRLCVTYIDCLVQNRVTCSCIVPMLAWPTCYTNDTDHWLPGLPASTRKIFLSSPNFALLFPKCFLYQGFFFYVMSSSFVGYNTNRHKLPWTQVATDMDYLTTDIRPWKCAVRRFRRCANVYLHKPR